MKAARSKLQLSWYLNLAFYYGNQYVELLPSLQKLGVPKVPPYRVRLVSNRIKPIIRKEMARLTAQMPNASVIPASSEDEDLYAAYAGEALWESISTNKKVNMHFRRAIWWMCLTGTSFIKTWWDPQLLDKSGMQGDIQFAAVTPFHLYVPDLREEDLEEQPYILNVYTKPVAWASKFYGQEFKANSVAANEIISDAYLNIGTSDASTQDSVLCLELWAKPGAHRLLPEGGVVHVVGDQIVGRSAMYAHGMYPFTKFSHIPTGKFYAESVITDLIPLQREYNRTRSQITEAKNRTAKPQYVIAKGSVDMKKWTTEPGLGIEYRVGMPPPQPMPLQPLPAYVINELDRHIGDMEDISGQHEVSKGNAPPGVTAATAISFLQEQDDSLMSHTFASVEEGWESLAKQTLQLVVQFWDMQRSVKTIGADESFDVLQLAGSDIKNGVDIRMEGGSSLPTSKAARQALIMDMMKMQFIDPQEGLKMLDMGGINKIWQRIKIDEAQAQRENIRLKNSDPNAIMQAQQQKQQIEQAMMANQGQVPPGVPMDPQTGMPLMPPSVLPVNTWDNHEVHITTHNNFRKTQSFESLPEPIRAAFEEHVNSHLAAVNAAMEQIQAMQGGMPPGMEDPNATGAPVAGPPGNEMGAPPNG